MISNLLANAKQTARKIQAWISNEIPLAFASDNLFESRIEQVERRKHAFCALDFWLRCLLFWPQSDRKQIHCGYVPQFQSWRRRNEKHVCLFDKPPLPPPQYFVDLTLMIPFILRYCDLFFDLQNEFMREWFSNRIYKFHPDSSLAHELKSLNFNRNESSTNTFPSGGLPGSAIPEWKSNDSLEENPFKPFSSEKTHQ